MMITAGILLLAIGFIAGILTGIKTVHWVAEEGRIVLIERPQV